MILSAARICKLSRFDAHQGVTNATIKNSVLGHSSVRLTGFGTFTMENSTVHGMPFISLRQDYGSTWTGDIHIKNCTYIPRPGSRAYILGGYNDGKHDFGYRCQMPTRLLIDGLTIDDRKMGRGYKGPTVFADFNRNWGKDEQKHPYGITKEFIYRDIKMKSGKNFYLGERMSMFRDTKVTDANAK